MNSNKQLTKIIGVMAVLFLGGMVYLYLLIEEAGDFWPHENAPGSLTSDIAKIEAEIQRLRVEVMKIPDAKETLEALKVEYDLAVRVLPRESSPDQLIAAIRTKAQQAGVTPDKLVPSVGGGAGGRRAAQSGNFEVWSFSLDIRGSYDQIATFVNRMEEFESNDPTRMGSEKRFFQVNSIDITAEANGMSRLGGVGSAVADTSVGHKAALVMQTYRYTGSN
jgi:Tfp pilus assembly protein PilO